LICYFTDIYLTFSSELSLDGDKGAPNPEGAPLGVCDCQSYRVKVWQRSNNNIHLLTDQSHDDELPHHPRILMFQDMAVIHIGMLRIGVVAVTY